MHQPKDDSAPHHLQIPPSSRGTCNYVLERTNAPCHACTPSSPLGPSISTPPPPISHSPAAKQPTMSISRGELGVVIYFFLLNAAVIYVAATRWFELRKIVVPSRRGDTTFALCAYLSIVVYVGMSLFFVIGVNDSYSKRGDLSFWSEHVRFVSTPLVTCHDPSLMECTVVATIYNDWAAAVDTRQDRRGAPSDRRPRASAAAKPAAQERKRIHVGREHPDLGCHHPAVRA